MRNKCTKVNKHLVQCLAHGKVSVSQLLLTPSFFFFFLINLFILFGCIGSLLLHAGFLQLWGVGASHCGGFSCCGVQALGMRAPVVVARGLSSCDTRAQVLRGMWDLPRPGLEHVSLALAGRFLATAPPGKSNTIILNHHLYYNKIFSPIFSFE